MHVYIVLLDKENCISTFSMKTMHMLNFTICIYNGKCSIYSELWFVFCHSLYMQHQLHKPINALIIFKSKIQYLWEGHNLLPYKRETLNDLVSLHNFRTQKLLVLHAAVSSSYVIESMGYCIALESTFLQPM